MLLVSSLRMNVPLFRRPELQPKGPEPNENNLTMDPKPRKAVEGRVRQMPILPEPRETQL